jgi:DNA polymerase-3 subunit delta
MIIKSFELDKIKIMGSFFLFYGENQGHKNEIIKNKFRIRYKDSTYNYDESEILNNKENFFNNVLSKSFFENEKLIIINRVTDKILSIVKELIEKKIEDVVLILNADILEKKSKTRSLFEKDKELACVAFYEDNNQTLSSIVNNFFRLIKVPISQQAINMIVQRARGDRLNLSNELEKIKNYIGDKKRIELSDILKITNLAENYNVSELVDSCLSKNKKKTINILNENNYTLEDCILIIRTFLMKSKRLIRLRKEFLKTKNIDLTISSSKPTIFWKDKEIVKQQLKSWSLNEAERLTYQINKIELLIKKHNNNSISILFDFIIETASPINS